jgi:tetratricopeptide (TPR) repeat protein
MNLTRSQIIVLIVLGVLTVVIYGCIVSIVVRNSQQIAQMFTPAAATNPPPATQAEELVVSPASTAPPVHTSAPLPASTIPPSTPTPAAPQTRYDSQVADDPENSTPRLQRGYAYIELGAYTHAVEDFDVAIGLDGMLAEAYLGRGEACFHLKEWSAALEDFEQALALNPDLAEAHAWRGHLLSERGEYRLAIGALRRAVALDETDPIKHLRLAQALLRGGSPGQAEREYTTVLSLDSSSVEAYVGRAMAQAEQGDFDAALTDLNGMLGVAPYDPAALDGRAWFYAWYQQDHLYEAEQLALRAVAGAEDDLERARFLHTLGWVYYQRGWYEEAVAALEEAAALATVEGEVVYGEILGHLEQARAAQE